MYIPTHLDKDSVCIPENAVSAFPGMYFVMYCPFVLTCFLNKEIFSQSSEYYASLLVQHIKLYAFGRV